MQKISMKHSIAYNTFFSTVTKHIIFTHDLATTHVLIRINRVRKSFQPLYNESYLVKNCYQKYFTVQMGKDTQNVSIDQLKSAVCLDEDVDQNAQSEVPQPSET